MYEQFGTGFKLRPFVDTGATWSTGAFSVHTDALGLRCDLARRMGTKQYDKVDWLFLGDSQGFGNGVSYEDTIVGTVAAHAAESGQVVRNACIGGQKPLNQLELATLLRERDGLRVLNYVYLFTPVAVASCGSFTTATVGPDGRLYGQATTRGDHRPYMDQDAFGRRMAEYATQSGARGLGSSPTRRHRLSLACIEPVRQRRQTHGCARRFCSGSRHSPPKETRRCSLSICR